MSFSVVAEVPVSPTARVYEHGWQSWSPTTTYAASATSARPAHGWQQVMRFRPDSPPPDSGFQGEGLLVVDPGDGSPCIVVAIEDPRSVVPSVQASLSAGVLTISADAPVSVEASPSVSAGLAAYGDRVGARLGARIRPAPTVWCSWYQYFVDVTEGDIDENLLALREHELPADVVQVDDGWQEGLGDWLTLSPRFRSTRGLAGRIHAEGRRAGIWLAPFLAGSRSRLAAEHADWLVGPAGHNWDQDLSGLDLTHPGVQDYLTRVFTGLVDQGFDYFKLDFLYAGAIAGRRHLDVTPVESYRTGLQVIRDAVGPTSYVVGSGAPILPSVGLVDAMRVSPDTYNPTDPDNGTDVLRGAPNIEARAWQHFRLWTNDPDCLVARPGFDRRAEWAAVLHDHAGLRSCSDRIADLDAWGLATTRQHLAGGAAPR